MMTEVHYWINVKVESINGEELAVFEVKDKDRKVLARRYICDMGGLGDVLADLLVPPKLPFNYTWFSPIDLFIAKMKECDPNNRLSDEVDL